MNENTDAIILNDVTKLDTLVRTYGAKDQQIKLLKKENDNTKERIKSLMEFHNIVSWTAGSFKVSRVESTTETLNEAKVLDVLEENKDLAVQLGIIKTKEYVDFEALESAIYQGTIPTEIVQGLDTCRESKTTVALRCTEVKKKED